MCSKELLLLACLFLLGGLRLTSTTTTTTFVAAMSIANQDLDRYFRTNATQMLAIEDRIMVDFYNYAFLNYSYYENGKLMNISFNEEKARYGEGLVADVEGKLVHISDITNVGDDTACSQHILGTLGENLPAPGVAWIALVRRGGCTFEEKVKHVYDKGAAGVIIFNDKQVYNLEKMQIKDKKRNITAVITYLDFGQDMARILARDIEIQAAIRRGRSGSRPINTLNRTSVLFVSISFIVLMVISLVWLLFYYIQRFRYLQTKDQQSRQLCSVTKKAIMKIPTKTGKSSDEKDLDSDCCAICIEAYKPSDTIRVLPCNHEFHKNCIDPWLVEHRTCPMCKLDVLKFYGFVFLGSEESILEYEPDRAASNSASAATAGAGAAAAAGASGNLNALLSSGGNRVSAGALGELIRSRDFVIDFPRIFVLEAGGATGTRETLFPARLPERSQSSMSFANARDWMSAMTNKLEEQHGLRRLRKTSARDGMEENLLNVCAEACVKKRRSRSADGRYSSSHAARQQAAAMQLQSALECGYAEEFLAAKLEGENSAAGVLRRHNTTLRDLTEASYAQSKQRQQQEQQLLADASLRNGGSDGVGGTRRRSTQRNSDVVIPMCVLPQQTVRSERLRGRERERGSGSARGSGSDSRESTPSPPLDVAITIQLNGEGVDLE